MQSSIRRFSLVLWLAGVMAACGLALRLVLWWQFGRPVGVDAGALPGVVGAGLFNDAVEALYLLAPLALYLLCLPDRWYRSRANRWLLATGTFLTLFSVFYLASVEYYFFDEFNARLNLVAFDYLMYPTEVFNDIWEAYPVTTVVVAVLWLTAAAFLLLRSRIVSTAGDPVLLRSRLWPALGHMACLAAAIGLYSTDTLARFPNRVANEIAINGVSSFFRAARTSDIDYEHYYLTGDARENFQRVAADLARGGGTLTRLAAGRLDRHFAADPAGLGPLNVVVVMEESFGAEFSRLHGSPRDWTPHFDQFARRGLWFSHAYASGTRTVRGLEAITTSFPPIPTVSILRRPGNEHIANWGQVMQQRGYHTSFLYGGYGYFDNMNYFYENNGFEVIDRKQIPHPRFANIWGVADEDLFDKALEHFDAEARAARPFFSMIMTTSNHKPFTFREGVAGVPAQGGGREAGVRYADYALGYFLRAASEHSWFDNTLFVVVADHGARVYGRAEIPLRSYEIPLMVYSPRHVAPREIATLATQIDIAPTVLGMLGLEYEAPFFGRDLLHHPDGPQLAFFSHNHDVAMLRDNELAVLGLRKSHQTLTYHEQGDTYARAADDSALLDLAVAYYQTASDQFAHHSYEIDASMPTDAEAQQIRQAKVSASATSLLELAP